MALLIRIVAAAGLLASLFAAFRFAMGIRYAKLEREQLRTTLVATGRHVIAEIPLPRGLVFFTEDAHGFHWETNSVAKQAVVGARLLLNGGVIGHCSRPEVTLPDAPSPEDYEGRERWDVMLYLRDAGSVLVPCGSLREGVSREIAAAVFDAVRAVCSPPAPG